MIRNGTSQFVVAALVPGIVDGEIEAKIAYIRDGNKPLLFISGQSAQKLSESSVCYGYDLFEEYILLPDDVALDTFSSALQNGLFICSFQKTKQTLVEMSVPNVESL